MNESVAKTCENCRHWEDTQILTYRGFRQCNRTQSFAIDANDSESKAVAFAQTVGADAILYTAPDFSCGQFEAENG